MHQWIEPHLRRDFPAETGACMDGDAIDFMISGERYHLEIAWRSVVHFCSLVRECVE
jgi:hypothetical protein